MTGGLLGVGRVMRGLCLGGRLAVVAGRGFGFDRVLGRLMFSREGQARAMLRRGFHLSGEDKGRADRQQDAGQL